MLYFHRVMLNHDQIFKNSGKAGLQKTLQHGAEFQMYFNKTIRKLILCLKSENHIPYISIHNVHAYVYK